MWEIRSRSIASKISTRWSKTNGPTSTSVRLIALGGVAATTCGPTRNGIGRRVGNTHPAHWCWQPCTWAACGTWFAWAAVNPVRYNYGTNVVYRDNYVYIDNQQVATTEVYYQQAEIARPECSGRRQCEKGRVDAAGSVRDYRSKMRRTVGVTVQLAVSKEGDPGGRVAYTHYRQ